MIVKNKLFIISQEKAKTSKFTYLNFFKCQPSWIKIDRKWPYLDYLFDTFHNSWLFYPNVGSLHLFYTMGYSSWITWPSWIVIHWLSLFHWIYNQCLCNPPLYTLWTKSIMFICNKANKEHYWTCRIHTLYPNCFPS